MVHRLLSLEKKFVRCLCNELGEIKFWEKFIEMIHGRLQPCLATRKITSEGCVGKKTAFKC